MINQLLVGAVMVLLAGCAAPSQRAAGVAHEADDGATQCRVTKVLGRQCLTAQQWQQLQRTLSDRNQAMNMGALMSDAATTLALSRQNTITATFPQQPAPAPVAAPVPVK